MSDGRTERKPTQSDRVRRLSRFAKAPRPVVEGAEATDPLGKLSLVELVDCANGMIADHRKWRLNLGHIFLWAKRKAERGHWREFYEKTFGDSSLSFRSAQRYIKLWKRTEARARNDSLSSLKPGASPESEERDAVTAEVEAELADDPPKPEAIYRLALSLSPLRRAATIRLWASPRRLRAEKKMIARLDALLIEAGLVTEHKLNREDADRNEERA